MKYFLNVWGIVYFFLRIDRSAAMCDLAAADPFIMKAGFEGL